MEAICGWLLTGPWFWLGLISGLVVRAITNRLGFNVFGWMERRGWIGRPRG